MILKQEISVSHLKVGGLYWHEMVANYNFMVAADHHFVLILKIIQHANERTMFKCLVMGRQTPRVRDSEIAVWAFDYGKIYEFIDK